MHCNPMTEKWWVGKCRAASRPNFKRYKVLCVSWETVVSRLVTDVTVISCFISILGLPIQASGQKGILAKPRVN